MDKNGNLANATEMGDRHGAWWAKRGVPLRCIGGENSWRTYGYECWEEWRLAEVSREYLDYLSPDRDARIAAARQRADDARDAYLDAFRQAFLAAFSS